MWTMIVAVIYLNSATVGWITGNFDTEAACLTQAASITKTVQEPYIRVESICTVLPKDEKKQFLTYGPKVSIMMFQLKKE